jgi:hypothetical protein
VFDSLCISFGRFMRNADRKKQIDHRPMTQSHLFRQRLSDARKEQAAIGRPTTSPSRFRRPIVLTTLT